MGAAAVADTSAALSSGSREGPTLHGRMNSLQQPHEVHLRGLACSCVGRAMWRDRVLGLGTGAEAGSALDRHCVADPSVAAIYGVRSGPPWPLPSG